MSILDRSALEESSLADLHAIASELSIDGYRRLRRAELIDAILGRQGGAGEVPLAESASSEGEPGPAPAEDEGSGTAGEEGERDGRRRRSRRGGRGRSGTAREAEAVPEGGSEIEDRPERESDAQEPAVEGVVELLGNGSGFVRVNPPEPSDDDVYVSAAQVKRCELVSGDRISGPRRAPRRSERFASLLRIDTINDRPASEVADSTRFDDLPAGFPTDRLRLGSEDPTVKAIEWLTPIGRGSRVTIVGPPTAGKTEALRRLAAAIAGQEELHISLVLAGVRPEEIGEWASVIEIEPSAAAGLGTSPEAQAQAVERGVENARRLAARGADAVLLIDSLEALQPTAARKALGAARNILDRGSLTVLATAPAPLGGETTVIALDALLASTGRFPALDLASSWTIRPELLVGDAGAAAIARARAEAVEG